MGPRCTLARLLLGLWLLFCLPGVAQAGGPAGAFRDSLPHSASTDGSAVVTQSVTQSVADASDPLCVGWRQRYTLSIANRGGITLTGVQMIDTLPGVAHTVLLERSSPGALYDGECQVIWEIGSLAPGETVTRYLEIRLWSSVATSTVISNCLSLVSGQLTTPPTCAESLVIDCAGPSPTASLTPTRTPTLARTVTLTPTPTGSLPPTRELPSITPTDTPTCTLTPSVTPVGSALVLPLVLKAVAP